MAKQTVNVGASPNDNSGDSIRVAFQKINANFTELYTALGLNSDGTLNLGAFEFTGNVMTTTDSSAITIDQATTVTSDLTVGGDVVPTVAQGGDLGSAAKPWRSLYVSGSTIYLGGTALAVNQSGELTVNGSSVADNATPSWNNITDKPTIPTTVSELTNDAGYITLADVTGEITVNPTGDLKGSVFADDSTLLVDAVSGTIPYSVLSGAPSFGNWTFSSSVLSDGSTGNAVIQSSDFAGSKLILRTRGPSDKDWIFDQDGDLTFPDSTVQNTAYIEPQSTTHASTIAAFGTDTGQGTTISLSNNASTEIITVSNTQGEQGRVSLPNTGSAGKVVIVLAPQAPNAILLDFNDTTGVLGGSGGSNFVFIKAGSGWIALN
jgi:hypothetical protein